MEKPKVNSASQKQIDKMDEQFQQFAKEVANFNPLEMHAPLSEQEPQTQLSNREMNKMEAPYIKPLRSISGGKVFWNEKYKAMHDHDWEYVKVTVENYEIIGESPEFWTREYACDPAHLWRVPVNKPIYVPRLVARKLANCKYHRLIMEEKPTEMGSGMTFYGSLTAQHVKHRIDCKPVGNSFVAMGF